MHYAESAKLATSSVERKFNLPQSLDQLKELLSVLCKETSDLRAKVTPLTGDAKMSVASLLHAEPKGQTSVIEDQVTSLIYCVENNIVDIRDIKDSLPF